MNGNLSSYSKGYGDALAGRRYGPPAGGDAHEEYSRGYDAGGLQSFYEFGHEDGLLHKWEPPEGAQPGDPLFEAYKRGYHEAGKPSARQQPDDAGDKGYERPFNQAGEQARGASKPVNGRGFQGAFPNRSPGKGFFHHPQPASSRTSARHGFSDVSKSNYPARPAKKDNPLAHRPQSSLTQLLYYIGDAARLVRLSDEWAMSLPDTRGTLFAYAAATATISTATFGLAAVFDLFPSLDFAWYLGKWFQANVFSGYAWLNNMPVEQMITLIVFAIAASPSLLEFFGSRLAKVNLTVSLALRGAVLFDAITDAPAAWRLSEAIARYIPYAEFVPAHLAETMTKITAIGLSVPVLLAATLLIEILFVSFSSACWKVLGRIKNLPPVRRNRPSTHATPR